MTIRIDIQRTKIFNEMNESDKLKYFDCIKSKYIHHIDTLYYSVFIKNDIIGNTPAGLLDMIEYLNNFKTIVEEVKEDIWFNAERTLLYKKRRIQMYEHCVSLNNYFDIFIASSIPNENTPRIVIQLRSIGLWELGEYELLNKSYEVIKWLCKKFDFEIEKAQENRIDYCYHTNAIQSPVKYYNDDNILKHLRTSFRIGSKVFRLNDNSLSVEYLSLGNRKSNNIFFRSYNKVREVIEENYKEFFIDFWYSMRLINYYDKFVYSICYKEKRYDARYKAMCLFYIKYGQDPNIKKKYNDLLDRKSCSVEEFQKAVTGVLPEPTLVMNIEFQTMRKFYYYGSDIINILPIRRTPGDDNLVRLFQILDNRKIFLDYLTSSTVAFVKDKNVKLCEDNKEEIYQDWWKRLRSTKIEELKNERYKRVYPSNPNIEVLKRKIKSALASISILKGDYDSDINKDMSNLICILNDNDMIVNEDGTVNIIDDEYMRIKNKRKKALKSLHDGKSSSSPSEKN